MNTLREEFDEMLAQMQTPEATEAMQRAFNEDPAEFMRRKRKSEASTGAGQVG